MAPVKTMLLLIIAITLPSYSSTATTTDSDFCDYNFDGSFSDESNSCFKLYNESGRWLTYAAAQAACVAEAAYWGWHGRLAVLSSLSLLNFARSNVSGFEENWVRVGLQATVPGSNGVSDWNWYDGEHAIASHDYGLIQLVDPSEDCATFTTYYGLSNFFYDAPCSQPQPRLCEFINVCNNADNNQDLCTYCLEGSYTSNTIPFYSTYGRPEDKPSLLNTISSEAVVRLMWSGPSSADLYAANYPDRAVFQPLCNADNAMLSIGHTLSDGQKKQTDLEMNLAGDDPQILFILYCGINGILNGEVIYKEPRSVILNRTTIDGDIHSIKCVASP